MTAPLASTAPQPITDPSWFLSSSDKRKNLIFQNKPDHEIANLTESAFSGFGRDYTAASSVRRLPGNDQATHIVFGEGTAGEQTVYAGRFCNTSGQTKTFFMHEKTAQTLVERLNDPANSDVAAQVRDFLRAKGIELGADEPITIAHITNIGVVDFLNDQGLLGLTTEGRVFITDKGMTELGIDASALPTEAAKPDSASSTPSALSTRGANSQGLDPNSTHYLTTDPNAGGESVRTLTFTSGVAFVTVPGSNGSVRATEGEHGVWSWEENGVTVRGTTASDSQVMDYTFLKYGLSAAPKPNTPTIPSNNFFLTSDVPPGLYVYKDQATGKWMAQSVDDRGHFVKEPYEVTSVGYHTPQLGQAGNGLTITANRSNNETITTLGMFTARNVANSLSDIGADELKHTSPENGLVIYKQRADGTYDTSKPEGKLYFDANLNAWMIVPLGNDGKPAGEARAVTEVTGQSDGKATLKVGNDTWQFDTSGLAAAGSSGGSGGTAYVHPVNEALGVLYDNIDEVDSIRAKGKTDGVVSRKDIEAWRDRYKDDMSPEGRKKYNAAVTILEAWNKNSPNFTLIHSFAGIGDDNEFTKDELQTHLRVGAPIDDYYHSNPGERGNDILLLKRADALFYEYKDNKVRKDEHKKREAFTIIAGLSGNKDTISMEDLRLAANNPSNPYREIAGKLLELFERVPGLYAAVAGTDGEIDFRELGGMALYLEGLSQPT